MTTLQNGLTVDNTIGRIINLGSSSKGNSFYIEVKLSDREKPFGILIESGFSYQELMKRMYENELELKDIDVVLITHRHKDHSEAIKDLHIRGKVIYAPQDVFDSYEIVVDEKQVFSKEYTNKYIYKDKIKVFGMPLEHYDEKDMNVYNMGYVITVENDFRILFVIDTKYIKQDLTKYKFNIIFIETNYVSRQIHFAFQQAKDTNDIANIVRYNRLYNSHMSLEMASSILFGNSKKKIKPFDLSKCELIIQTHLSSNHGTNAQYYNQYFKIKAPKHIKILTALQSGEFVG